MRPTVLALLALSAALVPAAADAATVTMSASAGPASETFISYRAGSGEANRLYVKKSGRYVYFIDKGLKRITAKPDRNFGNCVKTAANGARCPAATALISLRDRNDSASFAFPGSGGDAIPTDPVKLADHVFPGPGRDRVSTAGGQDLVGLKPDGAADVVKGGTGLNELDFFGSGPVTVDTRSGEVRAGSEVDVIRSFRRILGGPANDTLRGGDAGEALYGGGGTDVIEGNGGADYLSGDIPISSSYFPDTVSGGDGDDVVDVRDRPLTPTSTVDCGPGADRVLAQEDDRLSA